MAKTTTNVSEAVPGHTWWQWLLLYPALAVALLTSVPQWIDRGLAAYHKTKGQSFAEAERQGALWKKNLACTALPFAWYSNPENVQIDATICKSGDIFVRASNSEGQQYFKWVALNDVVAPKESKSLVPEAKASTRDYAVFLDSIRAVHPLPIAAPQQAMVVCQRFIDPRRLLRHVRTPQGCFDEIVDTYSGMVVQRLPVPCRTQC